MPILSWRKNTDPFESSLISSAVIAKSGDNVIKASDDTTTSNDLFHTGTRTYVITWRNVLASKECVDERSHRRSGRQEDQAAQDNQHHDDRQQPEFLTLFHELPQLQKEFTHTISLLTESV